MKEIIQMECQERNSSILEIYNESELGRVFIENGKIIHAAINQLKGERALARLLALPGGSFELSPFEPPGERTITAPWTLLLNQALQTGDQVFTPSRGVKQKPAAAAGAGSGDARVAEAFICSPSGEVLYEAQCGDTAGRAAWLHSVVQHAGELGKILPLGEFDRMDVSFGGTRIVSRFRADSLACVRIVRGST